MTERHETNFSARLANAILETQDSDDLLTREVLGVIREAPMELREALSAERQFYIDQVSSFDELIAACDAAIRRLS